MAVETSDVNTQYMTQFVTKTLIGGSVASL